jgi:predicted nucleic acid-binding protein
VRTTRAHFGTKIGCMRTTQLRHVSGLRAFDEIEARVRAWRPAKVKFSARKAGDALDDLFEMRLQKVPHRHLVGRAWQLRDNVSFYDGLYVALAEAVGSPLVTRDARLARTSGLRTEVELIGEG